MSLNSWFPFFSPGRGLRISATTQGSMAMVVCGWMAKDPTRVSLYLISSSPSSFFLLSTDPGSVCVRAERGWSLIGSSLGLTSKQIPSMLLIKKWGTRYDLVKNIKNTNINEAGGSVIRYIEGVWNNFYNIYNLNSAICRGMKQLTLNAIGKEHR